jgi:hypothetical protein
MPISDEEFGILENLRLDATLAVIFQLARGDVVALEQFPTASRSHAASCAEPGR